MAAKRVEVKSTDTNKQFLITLEFLMIQDTEMLFTSRPVAKRPPCSKLFQKSKAGLQSMPKSKTEKGQLRK